MEEKKFNMIEPVEGVVDNTVAPEKIWWTKCKDCGNMFSMSETKLRHFLDTYGTTPNRCYYCGKRRKEHNQAEANK